MGEFRTWLESIGSRQIRSVNEAKSLSRSSSLDTVGIEFNVIAEALAKRQPVSYEEEFPISVLHPDSADKDKILRMMGAFAQHMGADAPDTLKQAQALQVRGPDFRKMTPPIILHKDGTGIRIVDGSSRVNAAKLLRVGELRAFVIG